MILVLCDDIDRRAEFAGRLRSRMLPVWAPPPCEFAADVMSTCYSSVIYVLPISRELLYRDSPIRFKVAVGDGGDVLPDDIDRFDDLDSTELIEHLADIEYAMPPLNVGEFSLVGSTLIGFGYPMRLNPEEFAVVAHLICIGAATHEMLVTACSDKIYSSRKAPRLNNNIAAVISRINKTSREITGRRMIAHRGSEYYVVGSQVPEKNKKRIDKSGNLI